MIWPHPLGPHRGISRNTFAHPGWPDNFPSMKYAKMKSNNRPAISLGSQCSAVLIACCVTSLMAQNLWAQGAGLSATTQSLDRTVAGAGSTISFANQVAPLLSQHCGQCHVRASKGDFSMASFGRLASAPGVLSPGNPNESKLVTMIESGEMPPKAKLPAADLSTIKLWVQSGAAFDGNDRNASLASMGGGTPAADQDAAAALGSGGPRGSGQSVAGVVGRRLRRLRDDGRRHGHGYGYV